VVTGRAAEILSEVDSVRRLVPVDEVSLVTAKWRGYLGPFVWERRPRNKMESIMAARMKPAVARSELVLCLTERLQSAVRVAWARRVSRLGDKDLTDVLMGLSSGSCFYVTAKLSGLPPSEGDLYTVVLGERLARRIGGLCRGGEPLLCLSAHRDDRWRSMVVSDRQAFLNELDGR
jgi:hypothetical protein